MKKEQEAIEATLQVFKALGLSDVDLKIIRSQIEPKEKESSEEEPKLDPELQKLIKYYLARIVRLDRKQSIKLFGIVLMYFLSKKPKLAAGLIKKFKRFGLE